MNPVFKKLNYKNQPEITVLNAPETFEERLRGLPDETTLLHTITDTPVSFVLAFVTKKSEIEALIPRLAPLLEGDALLWMCYPKGTSRRYTCDFNRDTGWAILGQFGLEPVRMVAIDEDWSALRFRKVAYIKKMTRNFGALSEEGKIKSGQNINS